MGCTRTEQTFCRNSPAWNFIFYTLILVIGLLIFFSYFVKNVTRNFKNQDWLWINCQSKMHTSLCKGRSNSPTATTDKEGEWLRTGGHDTTALAAAASGLEIDWLLSSSRAGMSHDPFKREQMLLHRNSMHDNIIPCSCCVCCASCFSEDYLPDGRSTGSIFHKDKAQ